MLNLDQRSTQLELLDCNEISFEDIKQNLIELNTINTLLGGHHITLQGVSNYLCASSKPIHIVEIGSGGGDNLNVIEKFLLKKNIPHTLTGIDIKQECVVYARQQYPSIEFICSDYKEVLFSTKPSIIFNSLFCHHFKNEEIAVMINWMKSNTTHGFFINDLHRNIIAYYSIKLLTALFSKSYLVKNDAPLSVARSFTRKEWEAIFKSAGIDHYTLKWKWAFRHLICCDNIST